MKVGVLVGGVLAVVVLAGCTEHSPALSEPSDAGAQTVRVERGDVSSVVTVDAAVVAFPVVALSMPARGSDVSFAKVGRRVKAGQELGRFRDEKGAVRRWTLPVEADVQSVALPAGSSAPSGAAVAVVRIHGFGIRAPLTVEELPRLVRLSGDGRAQIVSGPGPMSCPIVGGVTRESDQLTLTCLPESDRGLVEGMTAVMAVDAARARNVLTVPVSAVAGKAESGTVTVVVDGKRVERQVGLGISDGIRVEITQGLSEGDTILAVAPDLVVPHPGNP